MSARLSSHQLLVDRARRCEAIIGARVLDLFAGSGALGIEALSRGASSVVFVEKDRESADVIGANLTRTQLKGRVRQRDVFDFVGHTSGVEKFDIIFADPPYEKTDAGEHFTEKLLIDKSLSQLLERDGIFVLEKRPAEALPEIDPWRVIRQKTYGATEVLFLSAMQGRSRSDRDKSPVHTPRSAIS